MVSGLFWPFGLTTDRTNLYVTNNNGIIDKIVISTKTIYKLATVSARPGSMTTDGTNLYVTNLNDGTVSKIVISTGAVSTIASGFSFTWGEGITTDGTNLYVESGSSIGSGKVSKVVISTGVVSSLATGFGYPSEITTDGTNLYLVDNISGDVNKIVIATGAVSRLATGFKSASMAGITTDGTNLYVTSGVTTTSSTLRKIVISTGSVSPVTTFPTSTANLTTDGTSLYIASPGSGAVFKVMGARIRNPIPPTNIYELNNKLIDAARSGNLNDVEALIFQGADVNAKDIFGIPVLSTAAYHGREDVVKLLLDKGADLNATDRNGMTALMWTAGSGNAGIAKLLIEKGANVNAKAKNGETALMAAVTNADVVRILLEAGADVNAKDNGGNTPLIDAVALPHMDVIQELLDNGADVNARSNLGVAFINSALIGNTALMISALNGNANITQLLISKGADVNAINNDGKTALAMVKEILEKGHMVPLSKVDREKYENVAYILGAKWNSIHAWRPFPANYTLTITHSGTGSGTITSSPSGINCGSNCTAAFGNGNGIRLDAIPDSDSFFAGWGGGCQAYTGYCALILKSNTSVSAAFTKYKITVISPKGGEIWNRGSIQTIKWNYAGAPPGPFVSISIHYRNRCTKCFDGNTTIYWITRFPGRPNLLGHGPVLRCCESKWIAENIPIGSNGSGSYTWEIPPGFPGGNYRVAITTNDRNYRGISRGDFTLK